MGCPEVWAQVAVTTGICESLAREEFGPHQASPVSCCPRLGPSAFLYAGRGRGPGFPHAQAEGLLLPEGHSGLRGALGRMGEADSGPWSRRAIRCGRWTE